VTTVFISNVVFLWSAKGCNPLGAQGETLPKVRAALRAGWWPWDQAPVSLLQCFCIGSQLPAVVEPSRRGSTKKETAAIAAS